MTGGVGERDELSSTAMVQGNGSVLHGPDLPSKGAWYCMLDLLDGRIMLI